MTRLHTLDDVQIASPCTASWADMQGDERMRFCGQCRKNVYNLSAMTHAEAVGLIEELEGAFCGRIYRRADGTALTADCPVGLAARMKRAARRAWATAAVMAGFLVTGAAGFFAGQRQDRGCDTATGTPRVKAAQPLMGEVAPPPGTEAIMGDVALPERPVKMGRIQMRSGAVR